jgi:hypothetical protein
MTGYWDMLQHQPDLSQAGGNFAQSFLSAQAAARAEKQQQLERELALQQSDRQVEADKQRAEQAKVEAYQAQAPIELPQAQAEAERGNLIPMQRLETIAPQQVADWRQQQAAAAQHKAQQQEVIGLRQAASKGDKEALSTLNVKYPEDPWGKALAEREAKSQAQQAAQAKDAQAAGFEERKVSADEMRARAARTAASSRAGDAAGQPLPGTAGLQGGDFLNSLPERIRGQVKSIAEYRQPMPTTRNKWGQNITEYVNQYAPGYDASKYPARAQMRKAFSSGTQAQNLNNFGTAIAHTGRMMDSIQALNNSGVRLENTIGNVLANQAGNPKMQENISRFRTDAQALANEAGKVFKGTGGSTEAENTAMLRLLDENAPIASQIGAAKELAELMYSKVGEYEYQWNKEFQGDQPFEYISPHSRAVLKSLGISTADAAQATAPASPAAQPQRRGAPVGQTVPSGDLNLNTPQGREQLRTQAQQPTGSRPQRTVNGETRYWDGSQWVAQ